MTLCYKPPSKVAKHISSEEASFLWNVSKRTVIRWCEAGRVRGAELIGIGGQPRWVIPRNAPKPEVKRGRPATTLTKRAW